MKENASHGIAVLLGLNPAGQLPYPRALNRLQQQHQSSVVKAFFVIASFDLHVKRSKLLFFADREDVVGIWLDAGRIPGSLVYHPGYEYN